MLNLGINTSSFSVGPLTHPSPKDTCGPSFRFAQVLLTWLQKRPELQLLQGELTKALEELISGRATNISTALGDTRNQILTLLSPGLGEKVLNLACEASTGLFGQGLIELASHFEGQQDLEASIQLLNLASQVLAGQAGFARSHQQALHRLEVLQGGGGLSDQIQMFAHSLPHELKNGSMLVGMMAAGLANPMATRMMGRWIGSSLGKGTQLALANVGGIVADGFAFESASRGVRVLQGQDVGSFSEGLAHAYWMIGNLRVMGSAGKVFSQSKSFSWVVTNFARNQVHRVHRGIPTVFEYGGIYLSQTKGHWVGLEQSQGAYAWMPSLFTLAHFKMAGASLRTLAPGFAALSQNLQQQTVLELHRAGQGLAQSIKTWWGQTSRPLVSGSRLASALASGKSLSPPEMGSKQASKKWDHLSAMVSDVPKASSPTDLFSQAKEAAYHVGGIQPGATIKFSLRDGYTPHIDEAGRIAALEKLVVRIPRLEPRQRVELTKILYMHLFTPVGVRHAYYKVVPEVEMAYQAILLHLDGLAQAETVIELLKKHTRLDVGRLTESSIASSANTIFAILAETSRLDTMALGELALRTHSYLSGVMLDTRKGRLFQLAIDQLKARLGAGQEAAQIKVQSTVARWLSSQYRNHSKTSAERRYQALAVLRHLFSSFSLSHRQNMTLANGRFISCLDLQDPHTKIIYPQVYALAWEMMDHLPQKKTTPLVLGMAQVLKDPQHAFHAQFIKDLADNFHRFSQQACLQISLDLLPIFKTSDAHGHVLKEGYESLDPPRKYEFIIQALAAHSLADVPLDITRLMIGDVDASKLSRRAREHPSNEQLQAFNDYVQSGRPWHPYFTLRYARLPRSEQAAYLEELNAELIDYHPGAPLALNGDPQVWQDQLHMAYTALNHPSGLSYESFCEKVASLMHRGSMPDPIVPIEERFTLNVPLRAPAHYYIEVEQLREFSGPIYNCSLLQGSSRKDLLIGLGEYVTGWQAIHSDSKDESVNHLFGDTGGKPLSDQAFADLFIKIGQYANQQRVGQEPWSFVEIPLEDLVVRLTWYQLPVPLKRKIINLGTELTKAEGVSYNLVEANLEALAEFYQERIEDTIGQMNLGDRTFENISKYRKALADILETLQNRRKEETGQLVEVEVHFSNSQADVAIPWVIGDCTKRSMETALLSPHFQIAPMLVEGRLSGALYLGTDSAEAEQTKGYLAVGIQPREDLLVDRRALLDQLALHLNQIGARHNFQPIISVRDSRQSNDGDIQAAIVEKYSLNNQETRAAITFGLNFQNPILDGKRFFKM